MTGSHFFPLGHSTDTGVRFSDGPRLLKRAAPLHYTLKLRKLQGILRSLLCITLSNYANYRAHFAPCCALHSRTTQITVHTSLLALHYTLKLRKLQGTLRSLSCIHRHIRFPMILNPRICSDYRLLNSQVLGPHAQKMSPIPLLALFSQHFYLTQTQTAQTVGPLRSACTLMWTLLKITLVYCT
jgi:hypothetical protein